MNFSEIKAHLSGFRVGIAGAGGLGSNCAAALARCGVGTLVIADFDRVEESNLNRQFFFRDQLGMMKTEALKHNLSRIDPKVNVLTFPSKLDMHNIPSVFEGCDVIVEAFDRAEMKEMLIETVQLRMKGTPLIAASGLAGWGRTNEIRCRRIDETLYVCGDETTELSESDPAMAPRVSMVAGMQANIVIELLMQQTGKKDEDNSE